ncbi:unnamed protein product [Psylliodes chrysocephalus]|uniref:E3 SUMO-protein ligase PIAS2 n=1 Tax=Psylliodes chrysocephalus TaxID=3402493 RepID=A0A9P0G3G6_9CUCU|nr:unnamed protein product [Psylliodes chrysocephala]
MTDNTDELKNMLVTFRVSELQMLLGFAGRNKSGRKTELQQRALELLRVRSHPIHQKIRDLYKTIQQSGALTGVQPPSTSPPSQDLQGAPVNNMPQTQGGMNRNAATVHPFSVDGRQMARQAPMYQQSIYSPYPQYSTAKQQQQQQQQQNVLGNYPIHPDVKFRRLPFYDVLADLLKPSSLVPQSTQRMQEGTFYFHLTPHQATDVASSRDIRPGVKCDYVKQVQMRFCLLETTCEQEDCFPPNVIVKVNNKLCPLPNPIPTNKPGVEPKRPPRPVNITQMVKLSPTVANTITVSWAAEYNRGYAISVSLVHKLSSMDLLQRLKSKGAKNADHTRAIIKEKLSDDGDCEIATTSLKVSLMCPLGKMRMTTPCRPMTCTHLQCFDASLFLQMNERKPTWNCPVCDKPALYDNLVIDGYFTEALNSMMLPSECNEIQLNKDGTWCVQQPEKKVVNKVEKAPVAAIAIDDSIEIIGDDVEIVSSNVTASSTTDKSAAADGAKSDETPRKQVVDLTISDSDDDEPAAKIRAIAPIPDSTSASSNSNQTRITTTSSVSSSGYPASPSVINLDSPSPPRSPPQHQQSDQQQAPSSCMMTGQTNGTPFDKSATPFMGPGSMPFLDLDNDPSTPSNGNNLNFTNY